MTRPADDVHIRELRGLDELARTPALARAVWGEDDSPEDPVLLHILQKTGGLVAGAFDPAGELRAYLVGLPTRHADTQHSHRLGVHPQNRRQRLGERLKRFQRAWCLERGITVVRWTFDPLLLANAHLNVRRLGATVGTYLPNYYGEMTGINAGVPSDRFEAEWRLDNPRVEARLRGKVDEIWPDPLVENAVAIDVPQDYYRLIREDRTAALEWRRRTRERFTDLFGQGYVLVDVDLARQQYLLRREEPC